MQVPDAWPVGLIVSVWRTDIAGAAGFVQNRRVRSDHTVRTRGLLEGVPYVMRGRLSLLTPFAFPFHFDPPQPPAAPQPPLINVDQTLPPGAEPTSVSSLNQQGRTVVDVNLPQPPPGAVGPIGPVGPASVVPGPTGPTGPAGPMPGYYASRLQVGADGTLNVTWPAGRFSAPPAVAVTPEGVVGALLAAEVVSGSVTATGCQVKVFTVTMTLGASLSALLGANVAVAANQAWVHLIAVARST